MRNRTTAAVFFMGVVLAGPAWAQQGGGGGPGGLRFTVSKETTAIVSPLKADGSPDYLRAMNERFGKGVTAENNGMAVMQQIMGTGKNQIQEKVRDEYLKLLGIPANAEGAAVWENFVDYSRRTNPADDMAAWDQFDALRLRPWRAEEMPAAAAYLKQEEALLARAAAAVERPQWWMPAVSSSSMLAGSVVSMISSFGAFRGISCAWGARATLRINAGDFEGFLADVRAMKLLGVRITHGTTLMEALVGIAITRMGDDVIGAVAARGILTEAQCERIRKMLVALPAMGGIDVSLDCLERWGQLEILVRFTRPADAEALKIGMKADLAELGLETGNMGELASIDVDRVDWNVPLKRMNERMDKVIAQTKIESTKELIVAGDAADAELDKWNQEMSAAGREKALSWKEGETKEAYSERVSRGLMAEFFPSLGKAEVLRRRAVMAQEMADLLLAAAAARAHDGKWPETLKALVPARIKAVPRDVHGEGIGDGAVRYLLTAAGPRVYSIGDNGKDDGGVRDSEKKFDDIGIGAELK